MIKESILAVVVSCVFAGCRTECWNKPGATIYHEIGNELTVNESSAKEHFASLSVDEQITVALYARNCPDDPGFDLY